MTPAEVRALWLYAAEIWPNYPLPVDGSPQDALRVEAWLTQFGDLPAAALRAGMHAASAACRDFFPPLGLLRAEALRLVDPGGVPPDPDEAWAEVVGMARMVGYGGLGDVEWRHPAVLDAVSAVTWREICRGENPEATRAHFLRFYESAATRHERKRLTPPAALPGGNVRELGRG